ncbi:MAG: hypothetical protein HZB18_07330 [Chloroflexi bacterium]|nr:hypothetical protein [Chloroflexota bacterium]
MKTVRSVKPLSYKIFWGMGLLVLALLLWKTIGSGLFSAYVLAKGLGEYGWAILNQENLAVLISQDAFGIFFFSWKAIFSLFFLAALIIFTQNISVYIIAQFVLPVRQYEDRRKAWDSFSSFINGENVVAIFVKEGNIIESHAESENAGGGVILVDLSSAVTLSQQDDTDSWNIADGTVEDGVNENYHPTVKQGMQKKHGSFVDARGPGLVFIDKGQKISSVVDLRPQSRSGKVLAYTRNGIQVSAQVSVTFSLSAEPEIIPIGYIDTPEGVELRWLDVEEVASERIMRIRGSFELDPHDWPVLKNYAAGKPGNYFSPEISLSASNTPYKFYRDRVFNAAYSKARSLSTGNIISWHEAPFEIAVDLFRRELLTIPYDDLYVGFATGKKDDQDALKHSVDILKKIKDSFARRMKLKGVVLFQYITGSDSLAFREGVSIAFSQFEKFSPVSLLQHNFNSLRSVGVVIKSAGFGNLQPVSKDIKDSMIDNWKARWEKEVKFINAEHDLESVRIQNRNRAQIQQEMTYLLSSIFQGSHTDEALALRVFQALEAAASNPGVNNDISPKEVIGMLNSLHKWLLIDRKDLQPGADELEM